MRYTFQAPVKFVLEPSLLGTLYPYPTEDALRLLKPVEARNLVASIKRTRDKFLEVTSAQIFKTIMTTQGLEVGLQQVTVMEHLLAWSSRVLAGGKLEISIGEGNPNLQNRSFSETDFRRAEEASYRSLRAREQARTQRRR